MGWLRRAPTARKEVACRLDGIRRNHAMDLFCKHLIVFWIVFTLPLHGLAATLERVQMAPNYHVSLLSDAWATHGGNSDPADQTEDAAAPDSADDSASALHPHKADGVAYRIAHGVNPDSLLDAAPKRSYGEFGRIVDSWVVPPAVASTTVPIAVTLLAYRPHRAGAPERPPR